jgi:hypothetical protein
MPVAQWLTSPAEGGKRNQPPAAGGRDGLIGSFPSRWITRCWYERLASDAMTPLSKAT